ncbi:MAG: DUF262 domain-containing protein [Rothia sp. (in: high G+C Gram-positive bacteria)]|uniref:DUF262 domain-containing protein n=1 Tax=Rothia sp. (in: high G+C Gram-positive bacteria) TaxID=1885016 RepID=UPI0026FC0F7E|nr:DUF262 domain-containing protein [Rothia sp. (in: high G+C Gram-positive bacteria)]
MENNLEKNIIKFEIESKTIAEFNEMFHNKNLVLQPEYQRKVVWSQAAQVSLIETILLGFPIPEIYLSYETTAEGRSIASVVDGQQRLTSILNFISGKFSLENMETSESDVDFQKEFEGKKFSDLDDETKKEFWKYRLPIRRLSDVSDDEIRKVFARVNRVNMVLTSQEIKNALYPGPFQDFLKDCSNHKITESSGLFSGARRNRGGDLEFFAESFGACIFGLVNKKHDFDARYDTLSREFDFKYSENADSYIKLLDYLDENVDWTGRTRWSNIIDMYTLIFVTWELTSNGQISNLSNNKFKKITNDFQLIINTSKRDGLESVSDSHIASEYIRNFGENFVVEQIGEYIEGIRNSSDIGARRKRANSLQAWIEKTIALDA